MIATVIFAALGPLVSNRCYPIQFPQELIEPPKNRPSGQSYPTWPAIRWYIIFGDNVDTICGTDTEDTDDTEVQFDVVAKTYTEMFSLRSSVIAALQSVTPPCSRTFLQDDYDEETKTYRGILRYVFHPSSSNGTSP